MGCGLLRKSGVGERYTNFKTTEIYIKAPVPDLVALTSRPMVKLQVETGNETRDRQEYCRKGSKKADADRPNLKVEIVISLECQKR